MATSKFSSNFLWIEKYRVRDINLLVIDESIKNEISHYISNSVELPNLILLGGPGTGKTTLSRIIIDSIITNDDNVLILNGSDQRGIETVRKTITEFVKAIPTDDKIKIVFIDEADYLTPEAWAALRNLIEKYYDVSRFIFTGNEDNFPSPIKSRSVVIKFKNLDRNYTINFLKFILDSESITYNVSDLEIIIDTYFPDIRTMVSSIQRHSYSGSLDVSNLREDKTNDLELVDLTLNYIQMLKSNMNTFQIVNSINKICMESIVTYRDVFKLVYSKLDYYTDIPIKVVIYKYLKELNYAIVPGMAYISFIDELREIVFNMNSINIR